MRIFRLTRELTKWVAVLGLVGCAGAEFDSQAENNMETTRPPAAQPSTGQVGMTNQTPGLFDTPTEPTTQDQPSASSNHTQTPGVEPKPTHDSSCPDQGALPASFPNGPVMRVTRLSIPTTASEARAAGCEFVPQTGSGTGLSALINLLDFDVNALVQPDENGDIPSVLLMHMSDWRPGQTPNQVGTSRVGILPGTQSGNGFSLNSAAMANHSNAVISASADVSCGGINSLRSTLSFDVPLLDDRNIVPLVVEASHIRGVIQADNRGVSVTKGTINGYLRRGGIEAVLHGLNAACRQTPAPEVCNGADTLIEGDISSIVDQYVVPFLGGLDARIDEAAQNVEACDEDCNAMTVCIQFETQAVLLVGGEASGQ